MGRLFVIGLEGSFYSCKHCQTHLALSDHIISKSFHCRHGKAYLFDNVVNVTVGDKEERMMITGMHTVVDIFCVGCGSILGWKYEAAHEKTQKYKEGKFILERFKVLGPDGSNYAVSQEAQLAGSDADDALRKRDGGVFHPKQSQRWYDRRSSSSRRLNLWERTSSMQSQRNRRASSSRRLNLWERTSSMVL